MSELLRAEPNFWVLSSARLVKLELQANNLSQSLSVKLLQVKIAHEESYDDAYNL